MKLDHLKDNFPLRVYIEDTDAGGLVYHSKYLNYAERGRTELLNKKNCEQSKIYLIDGIRFVVKTLTVSYMKAASLDDLLNLITRVVFLSKAKIVFDQIFYKEKNIICKIEAVVCCINNGGRIIRIPNNLYYKLIN